jgi:hypothetical protein
MGKHVLSRRIKTSGGFIEQKQPGRGHERPRKRHALLLTVREMMDRGLGQMADAE